MRNSTYNANWLTAYPKKNDLDKYALAKVREAHFKSKSKKRDKKQGRVIDFSKYQSDASEHPLLSQIKDIKSDKDSLFKEGLELNGNSLSYAEKFINNFVVNNIIPTPTLEIFDTGFIALTWRNKNIGILNALFKDDGSISFACHFIKTETSKEENYKGNLEFF